MTHRNRVTISKRYRDFLSEYFGTTPNIILIGALKEAIHKGNGGKSSIYYGKRVSYYQ